MSAAAVDIATLGLEVRSDGVVVASDRLRQLEKAGGAAERATNSLMSSFGNLARYIQAAVAAMAAWKLSEYIKDATLLAARVETLGVVMRVVGNNAGYTGSQMEAFENQVKKMGITTQEARNSLIKMAGAQMDLTKASQLARVAQDAAVIGGINSSEAFGRMIQGIRSGEVEILKTIGINVNFEQSYAKLAVQLGKNAKDLNELEKVQARTNAVLDFGKNIAGAYEASMGTAGKQLLSMARYTEELKLKIGEAFTPSLSFVIGEITLALKGMDSQLEKNKSTISGFGQGFRTVLISIAAEIQRVSMLVDLAGGTLTAFASRAMKVAEVATRFMTIGQFGDWFKEKSEGFAGANKMYAERFAAGDRELQRLADLANGSSSPTGRTSAQEQASIDAGNAERAKRAEEARKAAAIAGAQTAENWRKTYQSLRQEIENLNPAMTEYQRKVEETTNKYTDLMNKKGADIALLKRLKTEHIDAITKQHEMQEAIKKTSDEFKDYLRVVEEESPQNNDLGKRLLAWEDELKVVQSLKPTADIDRLNEQLATFERMLEAIPERAIEIEAAMSTVRQQLKAATDYKFEDLQIAGIKDPYEQQMASMEAKYRREKDLLREQLKYMKQGSAEQINAIKTLNQLDRNEAADTHKAKLNMWASQSAFYGGLMGDLASMMDQSNRDQFEAAKALNIGQAIMNTAAAIMQAMANLPPPANYAAAAVAAAIGAAQVIKIASTSYGGGSTATGFSAPSGSFSGGSSGGSGAVGSRIGAPITSIQDQQTQESMRNLAASMDNASLAIGRVADGLTEIKGLFESGQGQLAVGAAPNLYTALVQSEGWNIGKDFKNMFRDPTGIGLAQRLGGDFFGWGSSWERKGAGISFTVDAGRLSGQIYEQWKKDGGWFGRDKNETRYSAMDSGFFGVMDSYVKQMESTINRSAVVLNTSVDLSRVNVPRTNIATAGRSNEDIAKDLEAWLQKVGDAMAKNVKGLQDFAYYGESAYDALVRLSTSLQGVNEELELIGATLIDSTLQGADAAYRLADAFGGLDELSDAVENYFDTMFTESEQRALTATQAQRQVNVAFAEMGRAVPGTREQFQRLVNSLDLTTNSGAATFEALMNISSAAGTLYDQAEEFAKNTRTMTNDLHSRLLRLDGQTGAADIYDLMVSQEKELQDARDQGLDVTQLLIVQQRELARAVEETGKTLSDTQQQLIDAQQKLVDASRSAVLETIGYQEQILNTIKTLKTGPLALLSPEAAYRQSREQFAKSDLKSMSGNATAFLEASKAYNASGSQYQADREWVLSVLGNASGIGNDPTLDAANAQLNVLTEIRELINTGNVEQLTMLKEQLGGNAGLTSLLTEYLRSNQQALQTAQEAANSAKVAAEQEVARQQAADAEAKRAQAEAQASAAAQLKIDQAKAGWTDALNTYNTSKSSNFTAMNEAAQAAQSTQQEIDKWTQVRNNYQGGGVFNSAIRGAAERSISEYSKILQEQRAKIDSLREVENRLRNDLKTSYASALQSGVNTIDLQTMYRQIIGSYMPYELQGGKTMINNGYAQLAALPSFAVGTAGLESDMVLQGHKYEKIIDPQSSQILSRYGIKVSGGDNSETVAELKKTVAELQALVRLQGAANQQLINQLSAVEARLAELTSKARLAAAA